MKATHLIFLGKYFIGFSLCLLLLVSCNTATVRFYNQASDPFQLFIDGQSQGVLPANMFVEKPLTEGTHSLRVVQTAGYMSFPTEYTKSIAVKTGENLEWSWWNYMLPSN